MGANEGLDGFLFGRGLKKRRPAEVKEPMQFEDQPSMKPPDSLDVGSSHSCSIRLSAQEKCSFEQNSLEPSAMR